MALGYRGTGPSLHTARDEFVHGGRSSRETGRHCSLSHAVCTGSVIYRPTCATLTSTAKAMVPKPNLRPTPGIF